MNYNKTMTKSIPSGQLQLKIEIKSRSFKRGLNCFVSGNQSVLLGVGGGAETCHPPW